MILPDPAPEPALGGEAPLELPVDLGAGSPSAASTLAEGLRLTWDHASLLLAIVLPYALLAMALYAAPRPPGASGTPDGSPDPT